MTLPSQPSDGADSSDAFTDETRRLLQTRLTLVFAVLAGVSVFYAASNLVALTLARTLSIGSLVVPASTLAIGTANGALALRCRRGRRSLFELHALDAIATALTCWLMALVMTQVPSATEASISLQLGVTYVLMARAVLLPSSGRRTLAICLLALVPDGVAGTLLRLRDVDAPSLSDGLMQGYVVFLGLIHRDIKPSNVILCERGGEGDVAKVLDFGLVKDLNARGDANVTQTETLAGTPLYIAPESLTSPDTVDGRADLYSLGAVAYFLLVGEPVFVQPSIVAVCAAHLHEAPVAPSTRRAGLGSDLDAVILRCLEKRPEARFGSAAALREALLATAPAGTWTRESAASWWRERRAEFRAHSEAARRAQLERDATARSPESAVRVDLRGRFTREG